MIIVACRAPTNRRVSKLTEKLEVKLKGFRDFGGLKQADNFHLLSPRVKQGL